MREHSLICEQARLLSPLNDVRRASQKSSSHITPNKTTATHNQQPKLRRVGNTTSPPLALLFQTASYASMPQYFSFRTLVIAVRRLN